MSLLWQCRNCGTPLPRPTATVEGAAPHWSVTLDAACPTCTYLAWVEYEVQFTRWSEMEEA